MKLFSKIFFYFIATILLAWLLPWLYKFTTAEPYNEPFTLYSCITHRFASVERDKHNGSVYKDANGTIYSTKQFDSIMPMFFYRQLASKEKLPDSINGREISPKMIRHENFTYRISPRNMNVISPELWMIMESMPDRVDLKDPEEAFRMNDKITFLNMRTNQVNRERSELFNKIMKAKGFEFPVREINGNPTPKKEYDEGYLMIDHFYRVYHIKQIKGRPYVKETGVDPGLKMKHAFITEFSNRKSLGFLTDANDRLYVLDSQYNLHELPVGTFNPETDGMSIIGDMFYWTVKISTDKGYRIYALDTGSYSLADKLEGNYTSDKFEKLADYIFPFQLSFTSSDDKLACPRISDISCQAFILNVALVFLFMVIYRRRTLKENAIPMVLILFLGIFLFLPLIICKRQ